MEYIIPLLLVLVFAICGICVLNFLPTKTNCSDVKFIINGDTSPENLEVIVISAKTACEKHFQDAKIYIEGGDEFFVNLICKRYNVYKI